MNHLVEFICRANSSDGANFSKGTNSCNGAKSISGTDSSSGAKSISGADSSSGTGSRNWSKSSSYNSGSLDSNSIFNSNSSKKWNQYSPSLYILPSLALSSPLFRRYLARSWTLLSNARLSANPPSFDMTCFQNCTAPKVKYPLRKLFR